MKRILIIGTGLSSISLIRYLEDQCLKNNWKLTVADRDIQVARARASVMTEALALDIMNEEQRDHIIENADIVISMLPVQFHLHVARSCLKFGKSLITASYESEAMRSLDAEAREKGILILNEMGLDPGIDHMSAMQLLNRIREQGHTLAGFESFTGGLVAPGSDDNPWHYKFSWNPEKVVRAGSDGPAKFIQEGKIKYIPYNRLFRRTEVIEVEPFGKFEGYANRDSMKYIEKYNLHGIPTIYRGTLRRPGFCSAWNVFVQLGATDDSYIMDNTENMTNREFINSFLYYSQRDSVELKLYHYMHIDQDSPIIEKLEWLGIFNDTRIGLKNATPAQILQHILNQKWKLEPTDRDLVVMWHKINYRVEGDERQRCLTSSLGVTGENRENTAMAKTVGLPMAIAAKLMLQGRITATGACIPTIEEIYVPVLKELREHGIFFTEKEYFC
ncbi:MAG: saccharopine dehydrogenase NADP-binding domain-containing protein [Bacteroidales bacterium]|nr:saccharopine dehydrogenase NADP-binding domain-containing protein [Bacteroidales bacterium]